MSATENVEYIVRVHHEDDSFWAEVLDLPGCFATGKDLEELREALEEAISLYLTDTPEAGAIHTIEKVAAHRPMEVGEMRVKVPV